MTENEKMERSKKEMDLTKIGLRAVQLLDAGYSIKSIIELMELDETELLNELGRIYGVIGKALQQKLMGM